MALTIMERNAIAKAFQAAKVLLEQLKPVLEQLNIVYDAGGGMKETVTQAEMDEQEMLSGLTKAQLDDGMYALTATIRGNIIAAYAALAQLAARG